MSRTKGAISVHSWKPTGFDHDTNEANIWTCRKIECRMVKAINLTSTRMSIRGVPVYDVEYSRVDGSVIVVNPGKVPACGSAVWAKARAL